MPRLYSALGTGKQLNEIVMAGAHDAAINEGDANEKTQKYDIFQQAKRGVRFFDIRINAKDIGGGQAEMKAFHGPGMAKGVLAPSSKGTKEVTNLSNESEKVKTTKLRAGTWGLGLNKILQDAKSFVTSADYASEFVILKFDKSTNYRLIAEACVRELGTNLYSRGGNLNTKTLADLAGKVIVLFPPDSANELPVGYNNLGILFWSNLYKPPQAYLGNFEGLQYWGAGGTKINNKDFEAKIQENKDTQKGILQKAATGIADKTKKKKGQTVVVQRGCSAADPNAIGMMYWTTTGVKKSIEERNDLMWDTNHRGGLREIWDAGFFDYMTQALPNNVDMASFSSGGMLKLFMPNIVMIDFANYDKCKHIYALNEVASTEIVKLAEEKYGLTY